MLDATSRKTGLAHRNLGAAFVVLAAAATATAAGLRHEPFAGPWYAAFLVFMFPIPVACGLAAGFLSSRKTILWAPAFAGIASAAITLSVMGGAVCFTSLSSLERLLLCALGFLLACGSAVLGEIVALRAWVAQSVVVILCGCVLAAVAGKAVANHRMQVYENTVLPQTMLHLDADYMEIPAGVDWRCRQNAEFGCYEITGLIRGKTVVVLADHDSPTVLGVRASIKRSHLLPVKGTAGARRYLAACKFRPKLLGSLSRQRGKENAWSAGLEYTRLTLRADGCITLEPFPPFGARGRRLRART